MEEHPSSSKDIDKLLQLPASSSNVSLTDDDINCIIDSEYDQVVSLTENLSDDEVVPIGTGCYNTSESESESEESVTSTSSTEYYDNPNSSWRNDISFAREISGLWPPEYSCPYFFDRLDVPKPSHKRLRYRMLFWEVSGRMISIPGNEASFDFVYVHDNINKVRMCPLMYMGNETRDVTHPDEEYSSFRKKLLPTDIIEIKVLRRSYHDETFVSFPFEKAKCMFIGMMCSRPTTKKSSMLAIVDGNRYATALTEGFVLIPKNIPRDMISDGELHTAVTFILPQSYSTDRSFQYFCSDDCQLKTDKTFIKLQKDVPALCELKRRENTSMRTSINDSVPEEYQRMGEFMNLALTTTSFNRVKHSAVQIPVTEVELIEYGTEPNEDVVLSFRIMESEQSHVNFEFFESNYIAGRKAYLKQRNTKPGRQMIPLQILQAQRMLDGKNDVFFLEVKTTLNDLSTGCFIGELQEDLIYKLDLLLVPREIDDIALSFAKKLEVDPAGILEKLSVSAKKLFEAAFYLPISQKDIPKSTSKDLHISSKFLNIYEIDIVQAAVTLPGGFLVVDSPAGTGKSTVIVHVVDQILELHQKTLPVVVANSKFSAVHTAKLLYKMKHNLLLWVPYSQREFEDEALRNTCLFPQLSTLLESNVCSDSERTIVMNAMKIKEFSELEQIEIFAEEIDENASTELDESIFEEVKDIDIEAKPPNYKMLAKLLYCAFAIFTKHSDLSIIVGTVSSVAKYSGLFRKKVSFLIIDEASVVPQAHAAMLISNLHNLDTVLLIGDSLSDTPTVSHVHPCFKEMGYQSIMAVAQSNKGTGVQNLPLKVHVRSRLRNCRCPIFLMMRNLLYNESLQPCDTQNQVRLRRKCIVFVDVIGNDTIFFEGNKTNKNQTTAAIQELSKCASFVKKNETVVVLCFYCQQLNDIKKAANRNLKKRLNKLVFSTVNDYREHEADHVILVTTQSEGTPLDDIIQSEQRYYLAMTRAKLSLIIIGHRITLQRIPFWNSFFEYYDTHDR